MDRLPKKGEIWQFGRNHHGETYLVMENAEHVENPPTKDYQIKMPVMANNERRDRYPGYTISRKSFKELWKRVGPYNICAECENPCEIDDYLCEGCRE